MLEDAERDHILRALEQTGWVIGGCRRCGRATWPQAHVTVSTMRRLGIVRPKPHAGANRDVRAR